MAKVIKFSWWECKSLWRTIWRFKKLKMELPYYPEIPLLGIYLKKTKTLIRKDTCTPVFIAALFTIAKTWKQPKFPSTDEMDKENVVHIHNGILLSHKKEWKNAICSNMDGHRDYHTSEVKSDRERQTRYDITYMWNLKKWYKWTYL